MEILQSVLLIGILVVNTLTFLISTAIYSELREEHKNGKGN